MGFEESVDFASLPKGNPTRTESSTNEAEDEILPLKAIIAFMSVLKPCLQVLFHSLMLGLLTSFSGNKRGKGGMGRENQEQRGHSKLQNMGGGQSNGYNVCSQCGIRKYHDAKTEAGPNLAWMEGQKRSAEDMQKY